MTELFLVRGVAGAGKTTFARKLAESMGAAHFEADDFFYTEGGEYRWDVTKLQAAHAMCRIRTREALSIGLSVVVSNTFTRQRELEPYLHMAEEFGIPVTCLIVENRHGNSSIHDVPEETIAAMKGRFDVSL